MKQQDIRKIFSHAVYEVFEKMYYVFLELRKKQAPLLRERMLSITFTGPASGEIVVYFSESVAEQMIKNSLNLDRAEATEQLRQDCLKECLNMICGDFMQGFNPDRLFQMSLPVYHETFSMADADNRTKDEVGLAFDADGGGYFEVILRMAG
mgnify:CR=1 FL=1